MKRIKDNVQRVLAFVLSLVIVLSGIPTIGFAAEGPQRKQGLYTQYYDVSRLTNYKGNESTIKASEWYNNAYKIESEIRVKSEIGRAHV